MLARRCDIDVAVAGRKHAGRNAGRVVIAGLARYVLADQPAPRLEIQQRDLRAKQSQLHPLTVAESLALQEGRENSHREKSAGAEIGNGNPDAHRALARQARDRHQSAHALRDLVKTRTLAIGTILAEAGNRAIDDALVYRANGLVIDPEAEFDVRPVILDHDVGGLDHPFEDIDAVFFLQIEREAPLVAMKVLEIGPVPRAAHVALVEASR